MQAVQNRTIPDQFRAHTQFPFRARWLRGVGGRYVCQTCDWGILGPHETVLGCDALSAKRHLNWQFWRLARGWLSVFCALVEFFGQKIRNCPERLGNAVSQVCLFCRNTESIGYLPETRCRKPEVCDDHTNWTSKRPPHELQHDVAGTGKRSRHICARSLSSALPGG